MEDLQQIVNELMAFHLMDEEGVIQNALQDYYRRLKPALDEDPNVQSLRDSSQSQKKTLEKAKQEHKKQSYTIGQYIRGEQDPAVQRIKQIVKEAKSKHTYRKL